MSYDQFTADLLAENAALRSQLSALQVDAARLDWLELTRPIFNIQVPGRRCSVTTVHSGLKTHSGEDVRAAIDAAMSPGAVPGLGAIREGGG